MKKIKILLPLLLTIIVSCTPKKDDEFDYRLIAVKKGDKWGYVDKNGKTIILPKYSHAFPFSDGLALVRNENGKWGYIDEKGNYIIAPHYNEASYFEEGRAFVTLPDGYIQCIDTKGKVMFDLKQASLATNFTEGLALVQIDGKTGFVDKMGKIVIAPQFENAFSFSEGLAQISKKNELQQDVYGFIDRDGKVVIEPQFRGASSFMEGKCAVANGSMQMGYINKKGDYIIEPHYQIARYFNNGYAVVAEDNHMGYINTSGKEIALPNYDYCKTFRDGRGPVMYNNKWGYVDARGKQVIDMQYDDASCFYGDYAIVRINRKFGIIDKEGKYLVSPQYDNIFDYIPQKGLTEFFAPAGAVSHYVNPQEIAERFLANCDENSFRGINKSTGLVNVDNMNVHRHDNNLTDSTTIFLGPCADIEFTNYMFSEPVDFLIDQQKEDELEKRNPKVTGIFYMMMMEKDADKVAGTLKQLLMKKYNATEIPNQNNYDAYMSRQEKLEKSDEAVKDTAVQSFHLYSPKMSFAAYYTDKKIGFVFHFRNG